MPKSLKNLYLASLIKIINIFNNMKKILLFTSIILLAFSVKVYAQPTNLQENNLTSTSVDLSWVDASCSNAFQFRYKESSSGTWNPPLTVLSGTDTSLVGLTPATSYDWRVKCSGGTWSVIETFTTLNSSPLSISNAFISQPILCNGGFATDEMQIEVNQTSPSITYSVVIGSYSGNPTTPIAGANYFISYISTNLTTATTINVPGFNPGVNYYVRIIDSTSYYNSNTPPGASGFGVSGIYDEFGPINFPEPAQLVASTSVVASNLCFGDCIAETELVISGGTQPYTYTLGLNPLVTLGATETIDTISGLCEGNYSLIITDANGCSTSPSTISFAINTPTDLVPGGSEWVTVGNTNISCFGADDGLIENLDATTGGVLPYSYSLVNSPASYSTNSSIGNLTPGSHTIYYKDANGCIDSLDFNITEPPLLALSLTSVQPPSCFNLQDGIISVSVSGGVGSEAFTVDPLLGSFPYSNTTISALFGDSNYVVTVQDTNMCLDSIHVYMSEPAQIIYSPVLSDYNGYEISCEGENDGFIDFGIPSGGITPLEYSIDGGSNYFPSTNYPGLTFGSYDLVIRDANLCTEPITVVLDEPGIFAITDSVTSPINCFEDCNGAVAINPTNEVGQVAYTLDAGAQQNTPLFSGLCGDITNPTPYLIEATDDNGCIAQVIVSLSEPTDFVYSPLTTTDEYCLQSNGTASINVTSGGTPGYLYLWSDGQTLATATGLIAGNYTVIVADVNGCQFTENVTVGSDVGFTVSFTTVSPCLGPNSGSATVSATGTSPYIYQWYDNNGAIVGDSSATASNLPIGTYTVEVTDATLCTITTTVDITPPVNPIKIDSLIITPSSCYGINDAQIEIEYSGGQGSYVFSNSAGLNTQSDSVFSNLSPSTYIMQVIDVNGCYANDTITLNYPGELVIDSVVFSHVTCFGANDGAIQEIQFVGGTGNDFEFYVDNGIAQTNMVFSGLTPIQHSVHVRDVNGCISQFYITIEEPTELIVDITPSNWNNYQIRCHNDSSGFIDIQASGGIQPYNIDGVAFWNTINVDSIWAGNHIFTVLDANGCEYQETILFQEPMAIHHNFITNDVLCIPWNNGSVTDSVWGGVGSATTYSYLWDTGDSTYNLSNLSAGTYTITVTDVNECESVASTEIFDNNALSAADLSFVNVSCFDDCDGELEVSVNGGSPGLDASGNPVYNYLWDDYLAQNSSEAVGLCVDSIALISSYSCIVSDAAGCSDTVEFTLEQPAELQVEIIIEEPISCNGYDDGKLSANVTSVGTPGYSYSWNTGSVADNISNLILGTYKVTIEDANGCRDTFEIYLNEPTPVNVDIADFDVSCFGKDDGYITTLGAGGTSFEATYSYALYLDNIIYPPAIEHVAGTLAQDSLEFKNLPPGNYYIIIKDRNDCSDTSITVEIIQPLELTLMVDSVNETCNLDDGVVRIFPEGGSPQYDYFIDGDPTLNNESYVTGKSPGWYVVKVVDFNGCIAEDSTFIRDYLTVFLNPDTVNFIDTTICLGQSININIDSLPGLTYSWNDGVLTGDRIISPDTILAFGQNYSETYILTISDENNCLQDVMVDVNTSSIDAMPASNPGVEYGDFPIVLKGESIEIYSDNNNCQNYTWTWSFDTINEKSTVISPRNSSWYYINVEDLEGCLGYDSIYVVVGVKPYEAITPNNDGFNDTWIPLDIESYEKSLVQVFNRWGGLVFESTGGTSYQPWDGTNEGDELPVGTYYYIVDLNTGDEPQKGPITIIR